MLSHYIILIDKVLSFNSLSFFRTLINVRGMQVPCRYPADTLTGVRGMQVPCRYSADTLTGVRGMQVPLSVSGGCRCPAGTLQIS